MLYKKLKTDLEKYINLNNKRSTKNYTLAKEQMQECVSHLEVLLSKKVTMGEITHKFEREFSKYMGSKYAVDD